MINPFTDTNWHPNLNERRSFARTMAIGFAVIKIALRLAAWLHIIAPKPHLSEFLTYGILVGVALWIFPAVAKPFYLLWFFVACCIGIVMSNVLVAAFFFLVITPIGVLMRAFGRDPLQKKWDPTRPTYWRDAEKSVDPARYFRQF